MAISSLLNPYNAYTIASISLSVWCMACKEMPTKFQETKIAGTLRRW